MSDIIINGRDLLFLFVAFIVLLFFTAVLLINYYQSVPLADCRDAIVSSFDKATSNIYYVNIDDVINETQFENITLKDNN